MLRPYLAGRGREPGCPEHARRLRSAHHGAHRRQARNATVVERGGATHYHRFQTAVLSREPAHQTPQLRLALVGHRAGIHHREVRGGRIVHHDDALVRERLTHERGVVLVGFTAERMEEDVHGRTASPTSTVHTRSVRIPPRRSSRSTPRSMSARPWANARPVPADAANSVGALVPGPNGSWPPRTPRRIGMRPEPNSAPADQLHVSNAPGPAFDQERHAADPANRTRGLGARRTPRPPCAADRSTRSSSRLPERAAGCPRAPNQRWSAPGPRR